MACDVMRGVHGAGLTNMVFLPTGDSSANGATSWSPSEFGHDGLKADLLGSAHDLGQVIETACSGTGDYEEPGPGAIDGGCEVQGELVLYVCRMSLVKSTME